MPDNAGLTVITLPEDRRYSLRTRDPAAVSKALGVELGTVAGTVSHAGETAVACLGPDEWLILGDPGELPHPHSLVEISARDVTFRVEGPGAADAISLGCPRDLRHFPVGAAVRTVFDGTTIILWRRAEDRFDVSVTRSFAPFVLLLLKKAADELALEV